MPAEIINNVTSIKYEDDLAVIKLLLTDSDGTAYPLDGKTIVARFRNETIFLMQKDVTEIKDGYVILRVTKEDSRNLYVGAIYIEIAVYDATGSTRIFPEKGFIEINIDANASVIVNNEVSVISLDYFQDKFMSKEKELDTKFVDTAANLRSIALDAVIPNDGVSLQKLDEDIRDNISEYKQLELTFQDGYYLITSPNLTSNAGFKAVKFSCLPGEMFQVTTNIRETSTAAVIFYKQDGSVLSYLGKGTGSDQKYTDYSFAVPEDAFSMSVTGKGTTPIIKKRSVVAVATGISSFNKVNNTLGGIIPQFLSNVVINPTFQNGYYLTNSTSFTSNAGFKTAKINVSPGQSFVVSTQIQESLTAVVIFYNSDGSINSFLGTGDGTLKTIKDFTFLVPDNVTSMAITGKGVTPYITQEKYDENKIPNIEESIATLNAYTDGNMVRVASKYSEEKDLILTFGPKGINSIFSFSSLATLNNINKSVTNDLISTTNHNVLETVYTDYIGPYNVKVLSNADGDNPNESRYTGGHHGYAGQSVSRTARVISTQIFFDGSIPVNGKVYHCREVTAITINRIQSYQTAKEDGSGREVLEECLKYTFLPNGKVKVETLYIMPLEPVVITGYMGPQINTAQVWNERIFFDDDENLKWLDFYNSAKQSGTKINSECRSFIVNKGNNYAEVKIDDFGLGKRKKVSDDRPLAYTEIYSQKPGNSKAYFNLIKGGEGLRLDTGDIVKWSGSYRFYEEV